jgi:hypothetical protein
VREDHEKDYEESTQVEMKIRAYYRQANEINQKRQLLQGIEQNIAEVKKMLLGVYDLVPVQGAVYRYKAVVGTCAVSDLAAEAYYEFIATVERSKAYLLELIRRQLKIKMQIMNLEAEVGETQLALASLDQADLLICEKSYGLRHMSNIQIGAELKMDEKSIRYRKKKILEQLTKYPGFLSDKAGVFRIISGVLPFPKGK